ncbi:MAG: ThiF family adenylyltransferase, partial [Deltaproteobacteria bacterium]|nr:ThiF family adenylyltransferase [Deltaproteobacteria bacterium]
MCCACSRRSRRGPVLTDADRFSRFELIEWWRQDLLSQARVVVIGAGALGNEVVKDCALLGVGHLVVVDFDRVEVSNLPRAVLFRPAHAGASKAQAAAAAARDLFPDVRATALDADVVHGIGLGLFRWASLVIGAVDNREARLAVNRACYRVGTPWIDGAIEALSGVARVFMPPEGPCYECSMSELDWRLLSERHSCSLLNRQLVAAGKVPTTPTTASVIAGIQCQEALKLLHGRTSALAGGGFVFDGVSHGSYCVSYPRKPDCMSHEPLAEVTQTGAGASTTTARQALGWARAALGPRARLVFARELLLGLDCAACGTHERMLRPLQAVSEAQEPCPGCSARRAPRLYHSLDGSEDFLDLPLSGLGV